MSGLLVAENRGIIEECYSIGTIERDAVGGNNELINQGGLVGINRNTADDGNSYIINCYAIVNQMSSGISRGGVIGFQTNTSNPDGDSSVQYVYAAPYFQRLADDYIGGVIGGSVNRNLLSSYYDKTIFTKNVTGKGLGEISEDMIKKSTYQHEDAEQTWKFDTVWAIDKDFNGGYPYLRWQKEKANNQ